MVKTQVQIIRVTAQENERKLRSFIEARVGSLPTGFFMRLVRSGQIRIDGRRCQPFDRVYTHQKIRIPPLKSTTKEQTQSPLGPVDIIHADSQMVVVNKPAFLPIHGGTGWQDSVHARLKVLFPEFTPIPVHRLDKDTSGLLLCAAEHKFLRSMHKLWPQVTRAYVCWLPKVFNWSGWRTLQSALHKAQVGTQERMVCAPGQQATTHVHVLEHRSQATLILALLATGRTHQIRAHLAHHLAPIVGDAKYGQGRELKLHAIQLSWLENYFFCPPPWSGSWAMPGHGQQSIKELLALAPARIKENKDE